MGIAQHSHDTPESPYIGLVTVPALLENLGRDVVGRPTYCPETLQIFMRIWNEIFGSAIKIIASVTGIFHRIKYNYVFFF